MKRSTLDCSASLGWRHASESPASRYQLSPYGGRATTIGPGYAHILYCFFVPFLIISCYYLNVAWIGALFCPKCAWIHRAHLWYCLYDTACQQWCALWTGHRSRQTTSQVIYGRAIDMPVFALCSQSLCVSLKCSAGQHFSKQTNEHFPLFPDSSIDYRQQYLIVVLNDEVV